MSIAPYNGPMKYDEVAFRSIEAQILADLKEKGASTVQLRTAHCIKER